MGNGSDDLGSGLPLWPACLLAFAMTGACYSTEPCRDCSDGPLADSSDSALSIDGPGPSADGPPPDAKISKADSAKKGWVTLYYEDFESVSLGTPTWAMDSYPDDGPFSDQGVYFQGKGVSPPGAWRLLTSFGASGWLTIESYSRWDSTAFSSLASVVSDPGGAANKVLRLASPAHTDGTVVRPTQPLPARYRVSARVGFADFGDGQSWSGNGYDGGETAEPWLALDATHENGFYWLAILDAPPRPHNNVWVHHHRKVAIDSDNNHPPWMEIYDGSAFVESGVHPVMILAVDGKGKGSELTGKPFLSWSAGAWQPSSKVRAVDAYLPQTWYKVTIERSNDQYLLSVSGPFEHGGNRTYTAAVDAAKICLWHYNNAPLPAGAPCVDEGFYPALDKSFPHWPAGKGWPDYFMLGDPHNNYYEGSVYYDDIRLETWQD